MGFASGPVTFRRYFVSGKLPRQVDDAFVEAIRKAAFGQYGSAKPELVEIGWVSPEHVFDGDITIEKIVYDRFAYLQLRIDRTAAPPNVVRAYTRMEEETSLEASGREFLNKKERKDARRRALDRADAEAKAGRFRRVNAVPVVIDLPGRVVYFGSLGAGASDAAVALFRDTFDAGLEHASAERVAYRIMDAAGDTRAIEDAEPFHLVSPLNVEAADAFDPNDQSFLGREFLTWLWYVTEAKQGALSANGMALAAAMVRILQLDCDFKVTGSDTICSPTPGVTPEARAALTVGKQLVKAGLILGGPAGEYGLLFDGPRFQFSGLKLPDGEASDPRARLEERFNQMVEAAGLLDTLFGLFLGRRTASDWPKELGAMKRWANEARSGATGGKAHAASEKSRGPSEKSDPASELVVRFPQESLVS